MRRRNAFTLDAVAPRRGCVEEQIDQVIFEQVDLVYVEEAAVGACEQARLELLHTGRKRARETDRAADAILRRVKRQLHHGDAPALTRQPRRHTQPRATVCAELLLII